MNPVLNAKKISKYFYTPEKVQVLKSIDFSVQKGEFLSIVGKSGCGKSTLLYILSTMDTQYEGELSINNEKVSNQNQTKLSAFRNVHLGFVFQFHFLLPEFTVLNNVMLPALKLGKFSEDLIQQMAMEKLRMVDMHLHAHKAASQLSGGQQQRVAIARALINEPTIIMGDEPTGNLDKNNSVMVFNIFRELANENKQTIITVTHDMDFAAGSDRIITMEDGSIISNHEN